MDKNGLNEIKNNIHNIIDDIDKSLSILKFTIDYLNNEMKKIQEDTNVKYNKLQRIRSISESLHNLLPDYKELLNLKRNLIQDLFGVSIKQQDIIKRELQNKILENKLNSEQQNEDNENGDIKQITTKKIVDILNDQLRFSPDLLNKMKDGLKEKYQIEIKYDDIGNVKETLNNLNNGDNTQ